MNRSRQRSGVSRGRGARRALLVSLAVVWIAAGARGAAALDIEVYGLDVLPVKNGVPQTGSLNAGNPGVEYYLLCGFKPVGSTPKTATRFVFKANSVVIRDVMAPVESNKYVAMGEKWTPASTGTYSLTCQANPDHQPVETSYANNQKTKSFQVKSLTILDSAPVTGLKTGGGAKVQPGKAQPGQTVIQPGKGMLSMSPCPVGWHLTGPPKHDGKEFLCAPNKPPKLVCAAGSVYWESQDGGLIGCRFFPNPEPLRPL